KVYDSAFKNREQGQEIHQSKSSD
ncbi:hypothetical protein EVA_09580, partial [gut metagenome]